jgi:hypothetical protein
MAFFWVNQKQTWKTEYEGGYLWAPKFSDNDKPLHHWEAMRRVEPGDVIFSYVQGDVVAISVARSRAYESPRPSEFKSTATKWKKDGRRIDVAFRLLSTRLPLTKFAGAIQPLLPTKYSPIRSDGKGANEGYLFSVPSAAGRLLLDCLGIPESGVNDVLDKAVEESASEATERTALLKSRIGQGQFRDRVLAQWKGRCAVTALDLPELLRASHIKPWRDSNNSERLDVYNGLPLTPGYDAAFDAGLITFDDDGMVRVADELTDAHLAKLGISRIARIVSTLHLRHREYLAYHRLAVFGQ